jgi:hypothetical protein
MFKIMIDAVLFPSIFAYMSGILFAGTWANLGNLNSNGASPASKFGWEWRRSGGNAVDLFEQPLKQGPAI